MSDRNKKLIIPSHLKLDSLSLSCISTGLTPRTEIKNANTKNTTLTGLDSTNFSDLKKRLSVQLPSSRSLRTSIRINRDLNTPQSTIERTNLELNSKKTFKDQHKSDIINKNNVTTPKGFDFATSERAQQRLKHNRSSSSSILSLNLHQLKNSKICNPPLSARSSSSMGAESRISTYSRTTTIPKPFNFATDTRAASKSKNLHEKLETLRNRFNNEVLNKNTEFSEEKRLESIIDSMKNYSLTDLNKELDQFKNNVNRRCFTVPKSPKLATRLRSENKKAQLKGVLESLDSEKIAYSKETNQIKNILKSRSTTNETQLKKIEKMTEESYNLANIENFDMHKNLLKNEISGSQLQFDKYEINKDIQEKFNSSFLQSQKLPKLRGFLSMNSFAHIGRQSLTLDNLKESNKMENISLLSQESNSNINSIKKINSNSNIPDHWKFQATIARRQLEQLTCCEDIDFSPSDIPSISKNRSHSKVNLSLLEEDVKTPLPRNCKE